MEEPKLTARRAEGKKGTGTAGLMHTERLWVVRHNTEGAEGKASQRGAAATPHLRCSLGRWTAAEEAPEGDACRLHVACVPKHKAQGAMSSLAQWTREGEKAGAGVSQHHPLLTGWGSAHESQWPCSAVWDGGDGLTCGTLPTVGGIAGSPLESRLQGLVRLSTGQGEAGVLCVHLHGQAGAERLDPDHSKPSSPSVCMTLLGGGWP